MKVMDSKLSHIFMPLPLNFEICGTEEVSEEVSEASETSDLEEKAQVPTRLTTRQRAMLDRRNQNDQPQELVALPMGTWENAHWISILCLFGYICLLCVYVFLPIEKKREITEEEKTRKAEQALRRRRQQQKQAEEEKVPFRFPYLNISF